MAEKEHSELPLEIQLARRPLAASRRAKGRRSSRSSRWSCSRGRCRMVPRDCRLQSRRAAARARARARARRGRGRGRVVLLVVGVVGVVVRLRETVRAAAADGPAGAAWALCRPPHRRPMGGATRAAAAAGLAAARSSGRSNEKLDSSRSCSCSCLLGFDTQPTRRGARDGRFALGSLLAPRPHALPPRAGRLRGAVRRPPARATCTARVHGKAPRPGPPMGLGGHHRR